MKRQKVCFRAAAAVTLFAALTAGVLHARGGREFFGFYKVQETGPGESGVLAHLSVSFQNQSAVEVLDGTIRVTSGQAPDAESGVPYAQFEHVSLSPGQGLNLEWAVEVPSDLYEAWRSGLPPVVQLQFTDANGEAWTRQVDLRLGSEGEGQ